MHRIQAPIAPGVAAYCRVTMNGRSQWTIGIVLAMLLVSACSREVPSDRPVPPPAPPPSRNASPVPRDLPSEPTTTFVPLPTAPSIPAEPGGELLVACNGPPFSTTLFDRPADDELHPHPAAAFFRSMEVESTGMYSPIVGGWWMVADHVTPVWFLGRIDDEWFNYYRVDFGPEGWSSNRSGECTLTPGSTRRDVSAATWELDPGRVPLDPSSRWVDVLVSEQVCTGGAPLADRLLRPAVVYGPESVMVIVGAVLEGDAVDCHEDRAARLRVELREPLGDRTIRGWVPPPECCG